VKPAYALLRQNSTPRLIVGLLRLPSSPDKVRNRVWIKKITLILLSNNYFHGFVFNKKKVF
jgi:hypothetical protein